ncbi:FecR domain-containing protein [Hyphomonas sp. WL0036]|uniref:FecR family protein n=1 Tax=Hyphomonas sediminis TaxID=2866160 RepID=UPI001C80E9D0|nr:FecR domain-containing protein [Hyphomonas sediminis]MBY9068079.1 FecR domain-containing protein [Hyphomonas sediminis]
MTDKGYDNQSAIEAAAASWDARLRNPDCSDAERARFRAWCDEAPAHREAFDRLQRAVVAMRSVAHHPEMRALRDAALSERKDLRRGRMALAAASILIAAVCAPLALHQFGNSTGQGGTDADAAVLYATAIGQRTGITLDDGSVITLNTDSQVSVDYSGTDRLITLLKGQAMFEVAKDPSRPFMVTAGNKRVVALGTTFDVRLNNSAVEVILLEGKVAVEAVSKAKNTVPVSLAQMTSGERLVSSPATPMPNVTQIDADKATSWRDGYVTFEDTPLSEALVEMNRYSAVQISGEAADLDELRITGVFRAGQQARFADTLQSYFPIEATRSGNKIVLKMSHPL